MRRGCSTQKPTARATVAALAGFLLLGACGFTPEGEAIRMAVKQYGAQAASAELDNLEWAFCNAVTIGAFKRKYGASPDKVKAWRTLCDGSPETPVATPAEK
ncbi:MAG: hypothetical protein U1A72_16890 [Sulfuritalea sp.]|nr:hypothetical protein [Sulfuritalea sp.]